MSENLAFQRIKFFRELIVSFITSIFRVAVGIDHIPELVEMAQMNIMKDNPHLLESERVKLVTGDGRKGYPEMGPYDAIHVGAAAPTLPQDLVSQLKVEYFIYTQ